MIANILPKDTPSNHGVGSKGQTIYFCESSHVAYQIRGNGARSTMKANMLSLHTQTTPGVGSKLILFSFLKVVMLHIKLKWNMQGNTLNLYTPLTSGVGLKGQILKLCRCKYFFYIKLLDRRLL